MPIPKSQAASQQWVVDKKACIPAHRSCGWQQVWCAGFLLGLAGTAGAQSIPKEFPSHPAFETQAPWSGQEIAIDQSGTHLYLQYLNKVKGEQLAGIRRYAIKPDGSLALLDSLEEGHIVGHQGLSSETRNNETWLWASAGSDARSAIRFSYVPGAEPAKITQYRLFGESFSGDGAAMPEVCAGQQYLVARGRRSTREQFIRIFRLQTLQAGSGDYSTRHEKEWKIDKQLFADGFPLQGLACSENRVYLLAGKSQLSSNFRLRVYDLQGRLLEQNDNITIGRAKAEAERGAYEPEGLSIAAMAPGEPPQVFLSLITGRSPTKKLSVWRLMPAK